VFGIDVTAAVRYVRAAHSDRYTLDLAMVCPKRRAEPR
jgi:hypothetical protein